MQKVFECIDRLVDYAKKNLGLSEKNEDYIKNDIFRTLGIESYTGNTGATSDAETPETLVKELAEACAQAGLFPIEESEYYLDQVMGALTLLPKEVEDAFYRVEREEGGKAATEWFYRYSVKSDYVKKSKLDQNPRFESGGLVVTINKAKPEFRDPKKAQAGNSVKGGYPKCSICHANEGFAGRNKRTLRTIDITLGGQKWFWQFSPYGYFYQHGIAVNYEHTPMHVDKGTFTRLMDFVDRFPHYFIGCNAALPRIGGSVLAHDHYQGGGEILPMHKAKALYTFAAKGYPELTIEVVDWPGTVVRVVGKDRAGIESVADILREGWVNYKNEALGIIPEDEEGVHSAVSPTCVKTERGYEMSLIFRNNITSEQYPDGVFHAHPEFHVIKKESIGLIEAQGLFILPGRLEKELGEMEEAILEKRALPESLKEYEMVFGEVKALISDHPSKEEIHRAVESELGSICARILENTAVFKNKEQDIAFLKELNLI